MLSSKALKPLILLSISMLLFCIGADVYAIESGKGIGTVAYNVQTNFVQIAKFITAAAYIAGMGFAVAAVVKFKAHKDNPTQVMISQPIVLLFVAAALMFMPSVFSSVGKTLYNTSGTAGGLSGQTSFATS